MPLFECDLKRSNGRTKHLWGSLTSGFQDTFCIQGINGVRRSVLQREEALVFCEARLLPKACKPCQTVSGLTVRKA